MTGHSHLLTFLAGLSSDTEQPDIERIVTDRELQSDLTDLFEEQAESFLDDDFERVPYDPKDNYRLERQQIYVLRDVSLPITYLNAATKPHTADTFSLDRSPLPRIATIFGADTAGNKVSRLLFQQFRLPQLLDRKFSIFWTGNTFNRIQNNGLSLAHELSAIWQGGSLFFRSLAIASRFFDLTEFEPKATVQEIKNFVRSDVFHFDDGEAPQHIFDLIESDDFLRRRIASIESKNILPQVKPMTAAKKAGPFGIEINIRKRDGKAKIELPKTKKELKAVIKFLNEEYFHGEITSECYETNSLRRVQT